jgi:Flp pilus assembly pilin Flp
MALVMQDAKSEKLPQPGGGCAMGNLVARLIREEWAQDLAEYGVALALIAGGAAVVAIAFAGNVNTVWASANAAIQNAADLISGS